MSLATTHAAIFQLENDDLTFARLLGFYHRHAVGPDIEFLPDRSTEWVEAFHAGHEQADELEESNWDAAFEQGKAQANLDTAHRLTANADGQPECRSI